MPAFYVLTPPRGRSYRYAWKDTSVAGLKTGLCEVCGRTISAWDFRGGHCYLTEGGPRYPDRLPFTGAGGSPFLLSQRAAQAFADQGITGLGTMEPVELPEDAPPYVLAEICGRIGLDLEKMHLKRKKLCQVCGSFQWSRRRLDPLILDAEHWDGSDICRVADIPGQIICSERVVKLVKAQRLRGFSFEEL